MAEEELLNDAPVEQAPEPQAEAAPAQDYAGFQSPYEAFKALPDFQGQDDLTIARNLYSAYAGNGEAQRQLQQYQQVVPYANEYLQNRNSYLKWQQEQLASQAPRPAEKAKWWAPPEVDESYK